MPTCRELEPLFASYVDEEAGPPERAAVEAHLGACPPCRERVSDERAARDVLHARRPGLRCSASDLLRARCAATGKRHSVTPIVPRPSLARRAWIPLAFAATLVLAVAGVFLFGLGDSAEVLAAQLAVDHVKCSQFPPAHRAAVDAAALGVQWTGAHGWVLKVAPGAPSEGLELLGVRRCLSSKGKVAHVMYKWRGEPLSIYVMPVSPRRSAGAVEEAVATFGQRAVIWAKADRTYAIVARGQPSELEHVARYFRTAAE